MISTQTILYQVQISLERQTLTVWSITSDQGVDLSGLTLPSPTRATILTGFVLSSMAAEMVQLRNFAPRINRFVWQKRRGLGRKPNDLAMNKADGLHSRGMYSLAACRTESLGVGKLKRVWKGW